jgi:hypothetical protein
MHVHRFVAVTAVAGALSLGGAGVALAAGSGPAPAPATAAPSTPNAPAKCTNAATKIQIAKDLDQAAGLRLGALQQALTKATAKGNQTRVQRLTDRISKLTTRRQTLESRIQKLEQRCGGAASTSS